MKKTKTRWSIRQTDRYEPFWHCHSHSPHPMKRARWYTVVSFLYDLCSGLAIFDFWVRAFISSNYRATFSNSLFSVCVFVLPDSLHKSPLHVLRENYKFSWNGPFRQTNRETKSCSSSFVRGPARFSDFQRTLTTKSYAFFKKWANPSLFFV